MKNLFESILDNNFADNINKQVEKSAMLVQHIHDLENFIRDYFQNLYNEEFINIQKLYASIGKSSLNNKRDILIKDKYQYKSWVRDYKKFKTKFLAYAKKLDTTLPHFIDFDDESFVDINIYVDGLPNNRSFYLANIRIIKPGGYILPFSPLIASLDGAVRISLYNIDRCGLK